MKVIIIKESVISSWAKDIVTFGGLFALWYLNHRFCNGSGYIDLSIGIMVIAGAIASVDKGYTLHEAINVLKELEKSVKK